MKTALIAALSFAFLQWPWHHRQQESPSTMPVLSPDSSERLRYLADHCEIVRDDAGNFLYFIFSGDDGAVGSGSDCAAAFQDWRHTPAPRPLSRA